MRYCSTFFGAVSWWRVILTFATDRNTCAWRWLEWSSCSSICNLDGTKPDDAPTTKKRGKTPREVKVPQELCEGEAEEECPPTPCTGRTQLAQPSNSSALRHSLIFVCASAVFVWRLDRVPWWEGPILQRHLRKSPVLLGVQNVYSHPDQPAQGIIL